MSGAYGSLISRRLFRTYSSELARLKQRLRKRFSRWANKGVWQLTNSVQPVSHGRGGAAPKEAAWIGTICFR